MVRQAHHQNHPEQRRRVDEKSILPEDRYYTKEHEWVRIDPDGIGVVGLTDHAQEALGEVTYVELPPIGKELEQFDELAVVESAKAASEAYAPVGGRVIEVNEQLEESPGLINQEPYTEGWLCKLSDVDVAQVENLLTPRQYAKLLESEVE